jgi:hypothetical protein
VLFSYADDVNILGDNIGTVNESTDTLIGASKEVGLEVNTEKTKYMLLCRHQNAGQYHDINIADRFVENVAQFTYFVKTIKKKGKVFTVLN